jgi:hypothetical protein
MVEETLCVVCLLMRVRGVVDDGASKLGCVVVGI